MSLDRRLLGSHLTMERPRPPTFDLAALAHPAWWVALGVLLVNDNLLKGRGVVPGWLTGKLSDLAFVVVAPTLFAAILPRALPGRRTLALASVIGLYVAADLSRAVSDGFVAVLARIGVAARLWPDVTDLLALALLPLTIHLMRRPAPREETRVRFTLQRIGVMVGAAACLATSGPLGYEHQPFLFNATSGTRTVRVTWVLKQLPCDPPETVAAALTPNDLDDPRSYDLGSGQVAALDGVPAMGQSPVGVCPDLEAVRYPRPTGCVGAILESEGAAPVLMVAPAGWEEYNGDAFFSCQNPPSPVSRCQPHLPPTSNPGRDAVSLGQVNGQLSFVVGAGQRASSSKFDPPRPPMEKEPKVRIAPIDPAAVAARAPIADGCRALRNDYQTLIASPTCAVDLDCVGRLAAPIPEGPACEIDINIGAAAMIEELDAKWRANCGPIATTRCDAFPQPAVCRDGHCGPACPGVVVPTCPPACTNLETPDTQACEYYFQRCRRPDGKTCSCVGGHVSCVAPAPVSATCPLICIDPPGGGTFQPP